MKIVNRATADLIPYALNAKKHDEVQIANVANSIKRFGWVQPIVIDDDNVVVIGHCRLLAAKRLGLDEVPVTVASGLTDEEIRELRIADNRLNESAWDFDLLEQDRQGLDFEGFVFDWTQQPDDEEAPPEPVTVEDNFDPEDVPEESDIQPGDIFLLGRHRLMCGNSANINDVLALMGGAKVDLFLTDPPYNVNYKFKQNDGLKFRTNKRVDQGSDDIDNDDMDYDRFYGFLMSAFGCADKVMRDGAAFYIWHADLTGHLFRQAIVDTKWNMKQTLIWVKNRFALSRNDYHYKHEPCAYGWKPGAAHYFINDRTQHTVLDDKIDIKKLKKEEMQALLEQIFADNVQTTVLYEDKPMLNDIHPTMKPIKLMARLIVNSSQPGWNVLDLFGGSGSTMMACEQLGRTCYTMEILPEYCEAMIQRFVRFTGEQVYRLVDGQKVPYETSP